MKKLMRKSMLSCDKATFLITKEQEGEISFMQKIQLEMHLMACKFCTLFKKQSAFISDNVDHLHQHSEESLPDKLEDERKVSMKKAMQSELEKDSENN